MQQYPVVSAGKHAYSIQWLARENMHAVSSGKRGKTCMQYPVVSAGKHVFRGKRGKGPIIFGIVYVSDLLQSRHLYTEFGKGRYKILLGFYILEQTDYTPRIG